MKNISNTYINAVLADAVYIDLAPGMSTEKIAGALMDRMTSAQAKFIADNFEVVSAINTPDARGQGSGFDAIVWRGRAGSSFAGQVFVSTRGTQPEAGGADLEADADLALGVAAREQIIDMVNWWLQETAPEGSSAKQIRAIKTDVIVVGPTGPTVVTEFKVLSADPVSGTGRLKDVTNVQINGHSLGGHLASSFARIFGGATQEKGSVAVDGISTFNSAGFIRAGAESFFAELQNLLGTGLPSFNEVQAKQANFYAENGINVTTNEAWFRQMGERIGLDQEEGFADANHSMYRLTDMLALGAALHKLDPGMDTATLNALALQDTQASDHTAANNAQWVVAA